MSMAMDKPTKVEVGQRWKSTGLEGTSKFAFTVIGGSAEDGWKLKSDDGVPGDWSDAGLKRLCTFLGWAEGFAPSPSSPGRPAGRDWSRWLPKETLAEREAPVFKVGQVYVVADSARGYMFVGEVTHVDGVGDAFYRVLAGSCGGFERPCTTRGASGRHAVLVADVGCEPTPPEVLYGPRSSTQGEPGAGEKVSCVDCAADITERVKAAMVGGGWRCVACNGEFHTRVILAKRKPAPTVTSNPRRAIPASCQLERWDETGPLSALEAVPSRQPPEPWRPGVDEYDLLPDAGTSWSYSKPSSPGGGE